MTQIELQEVLGDRITMALRKDLTPEERQTENEQSRIILGLAKQMINNGDLILRTEKLVGEDPESGKNLYADLTNVCQRRFSAFGERCMHIAPEHMENVKNRMARLLKVDIHPVGDQGTVQKLREDLAKISTDYNKLNDEFSAYKVNRQNYVEGLHQQFKGIIHEKKEADKAKDELQARLDASVGVIDKLTAENNDLKTKLADIQTTHQECVDSGVLETEDLDHNTDLYIAIATLRAQKELLEKQLNEYLAIIDRLLPVNKEV